ncbi:PilZ domain-containing protein [uncultured Desulfobacter sp.]|uniref:PilZ domain-containing protein n=1 Tax=uncultured Desulfobacter sp. TaxID=240139 RepID=UPI002AAABD95|nr:PilZ domain-containing protein [uncultured Desulfobacter sp.]
MVGRKRTIERRKHKRFKAAEGAYAAISPNSNKLGQIIDISMDGLCFKYIDTENMSDEPEKRNDESIFLSSMGYYVGDLPFQTIADYEITDMPSFSSMKVRKRHVKFTDLTFKQLFDLDCYMKNNVLEQVKQLPKKTKQ